MQVLSEELLTVKDDNTHDNGGTYIRSEKMTGKKAQDQALINTRLYYQM